MGGGPPCFPQGSTCLVVLWSMSEASFVSPTGLLPSMVRLSRRLRLQSPLLYDISATPNTQRYWVWALPLSLAATEGIEFSFFSSGYLDVSVPPVASRCLMYWAASVRLLAGRVAPFGNPRFNACLRLPEAFRSLPRPSSAPGAKASTLCSL